MDILKIDYSDSEIIINASNVQFSVNKLYSFQI